MSGELETKTATELGVGTKACRMVRMRLVLPVWTLPMVLLATAGCAPADPNTPEPQGQERNHGASHSKSEDTTQAGVGGAEDAFGPDKDFPTKAHRALRDSAERAFPAAANLHFTAVNLPRIGCESATRPLAVIVAARVLNLDYRWHSESLMGSDEVEFDPEDFARPLPLTVEAIAVEDDGNAAARAINSTLIVESGTAGVYRELIAGEIDLVLATVKPDDSILVEAATAFVPLEQHAVARDAVVVARRAAAPGEEQALPELRVDEETGMLRSATAKDQGSAEDSTAGSFQFVLDGAVADIRQRAAVWQSAAPVDCNTEVIARSSRILNKIGDSPLRLLVTTRARLRFQLSPLGTFEPLAVNRVRPDDDALIEGRYPLVVTLYAVTRADLPAEAPARIVLRWLLGPEGQRVVREGGWQPVRPTLAPSS